MYVCITEWSFHDSEQFFPQNSCFIQDEGKGLRQLCAGKRLSTGLISCTVWKACNKRKDKELQDETGWPGQTSSDLEIPPLLESSCRGVRQIVQSRTVIKIISLSDEY